MALPEAWQHISGWQVGKGRGIETAECGNPGTEGEKKPEQAPVQLTPQTSANKKNKGRKIRLRTWQPIRRSARASIESA